MGAACSRDDSSNTTHPPTIGDAPTKATPKPKHVSPSVEPHGVDVIPSHVVFAEPVRAEPSSGGARDQVTVQGDIVDVLVIGCGLSGVTTANILSSKGLTVELHESNAYLGGKVRTEHVQVDGRDVRYDMGAHTFSNQQRSFQKLFTHTFPELSSLLVPLSSSSEDVADVVMIGGHVYRFKTSQAWMGISGLPPLKRSGNNDGLDFMAHLLPFSVVLSQSKVCEAAVDVDNPMETPKSEELDAMTVQEWLDKLWWLPQAAKDRLTWSIRTQLSTEPSEVGYLWWIRHCKSHGGLIDGIDTFKSPGNQLYLKDGGLSQLVAKLAHPVAKQRGLFYNHRVSRVESTHDMVTVTFDDGTSRRGRRCVFAMAPASTTSIEFEPPLPEDRKVLQKCNSMGRVFKAILFYRQRWWRNHTIHGVPFSGSVVGSGVVGKSKFDDPIAISVVSDCSASNGAAKESESDSESESGSGSGGPFMLSVQAMASDTTSFGANIYSSDYMAQRIYEQLAALFQLPIAQVSGAVHVEVGVWGPNTWWSHSLKGPSSSMGPGSMKGVGKLLGRGVNNRAEGVGGNILFTGAEYATVRPGTLCGAVDAGCSAAQEILKQMGKSTTHSIPCSSAKDDPVVQKCLTKPKDAQRHDFETFYESDLLSGKVKEETAHLFQDDNSVSTLLKQYAETLEAVLQHAAWVTHGMVTELADNVMDVVESFSSFKPQCPLYSIHARTLSAWAVEHRLSPADSLLPMRVLLYTLHQADMEATLASALALSKAVSDNLSKYESLTNVINDVFVRAADSH